MPAGPRGHPRLIGTLLLRPAGVHPIALRQNAALHVADVLKTGLAQDTAGFGAAHAALAVDHDVGFGVDLVQALGNLAQRDQPGGGDVADLVLAGGLFPTKLKRPRRALAEGRRGFSREIIAAGRRATAVAAACGRLRRVARAPGSGCRPRGVSGWPGRREPRR